MLTFAANLSMLFTEKPFIERFKAAANAGFSHVEFLFPYDHAIDDLTQQLVEHRLTPVLFNAPAGDWNNGERGMAAIKGRKEEFRVGIEKALHYAKSLQVPRIHVMSGIAPLDSGVEFDDTLFIDNIRWAADRFATAGIELLLEPLNQRDNEGYYLSSFEQTISLITKAARSNIKIQFDTYHAQIIAGDLSRNLQKYMPLIGHIQIASVPERHEPACGEVNYPYLFSQLNKLKYQGNIGCEYNPATSTEAGLDWVAPYLACTTNL
ncbi:hydroxypyruvate isomerase [Photobacterium gaetbulicola]|uniref:Hydroxypyruvate isomerase n=1 Tax=Photobacterium gaetbulicola TaxID=1295392 RepID=A0A0B9FZ58_9GAMM|nr:2-oxo-tetronate isomerase [Photobacterium gaetbulicola]KHT61833.1 hydroxypyruvate isomerase [Photobacterium gaetbulicola]